MRIKRLILVFIILILCVSCNDTFRYEYDKMVKTVEKIELVKVDSLTDNEILLKVLNEEEKISILSDLSEIEFTYPWFGDPPDVGGLCIKFYYINNEIELLCHCKSSFRNIGCDEKIFNEMIYKYYPDD